MKITLYRLSLERRYHEMKKTNKPTSKYCSLQLSALRCQCVETHLSHKECHHIPADNYICKALHRCHRFDNEFYIQLQEKNVIR